jgi:hypothetical protein
MNDGKKGFPIEIKLSQSFHSDYKRQIEKWLELKNNEAQKGSSIYCGNHIVQKESSIPGIPWYTL